MKKTIIELRKFVEIHRVLQDETLEYFERTTLNQNLNQISLLVGDLERAFAESSNENGALPIPDVVGQSEQFVCYVCKTNPVEVEDDICKNCADESE